MNPSASISDKNSPSTAYPVGPTRSGTMVHTPWQLPPPMPHPTSLREGQCIQCQAFTKWVWACPDCLADGFCYPCAVDLHYHFAEVNMPSEQTNACPRSLGAWPAGGRWCVGLPVALVNAVRRGDETESAIVGHQCVRHDGQCGVIVKTRT